MEEIPSAAFSTETSELSSGQSRRLRLRRGAESRHFDDSPKGNHDYYCPLGDTEPSPVSRTVSNPSAISVSAAGIADASTRCLLRLTRSGRYRLWRFPHWGTASLAPHFDTPKAFVFKQSTKSLLTHTISMANHPNNYNNNLLSVPFFYHIIL